MPNPSAAWTRLLTAGLAAFAMQATADAAPASAAAVDVPQPGAPESFLVRIAEPASARAVRDALAGAFQRLGDERCAAIVDDFRDGAGTPLRSRLASIAQTPQAALLTLFFYDGSSSSACRAGQAWASTEPGSRVIRVCTGIGFIDRSVRHPERVELWMIHEMLHSLGLEENPPSSREITRRVAARCRESG